MKIASFEFDYHFFASGRLENKEAGDYWGYFGEENFVEGSFKVHAAFRGRAKFSLKYATFMFLVHVLKYKTGF